MSSSFSLPRSSSLSPWQLAPYAPLQIVLLVSFSCLLALSILLPGLRLWSRRIKKMRLRLNDWLLFAACVSPRAPMFMSRLDQPNTRVSVLQSRFLHSPNPGSLFGIWSPKARAPEPWVTAVNQLQSKDLWLKGVLSCLISLFSLSRPTQ